MSDLLLSNNYFRNWHRPATWYRAKKVELSNLYPVRVHKVHNGNVEMTFMEQSGQQVTFYLDKKTVDFLKERLNTP